MVGYANLMHKFDSSFSSPWRLLKCDRRPNQQARARAHAHTHARTHARITTHHTSERVCDQYAHGGKNTG